MPRSRSKKMRRRHSRHIRHKGRRTRASRRIKRRRRVSRRQMRGGSNQWTCARKSLKDNKLYETISPGEKIQTLLSDNRFTSSREVPPRGEYSEGTLSKPDSSRKLKLPPKEVPPPGTLQQKSSLSKSYSNKKAMEKLGKIVSQDTTSKQDNPLLSQDYGSQQRISNLQKSHSNKEPIKRLDKSKKTTRKYIEDHLAKRREVIGDEHSAQNPGFNPDDPKS